MKVLDLIGKRFGRLVVISRSNNTKNGKSQWLCRCDCGEEKIINSSDLQSGNTKSCGCLHKEFASKIGKLNKKHGHAKHGKESKTYKAWRGMLERCNNKNNIGYKYYGERKIIVCNRWSPDRGGSFKNFLEDMGKCPGKEYSIDRINNNKGYYKENCRWATNFQQHRNMRSNIMIPFDKKFLCLKDYCKENNLSYNTILNRINKLGWSLKKALTTPVRKGKKK